MDRVRFSDDTDRGHTGWDAGMSKRCYYDVLEVERAANDGELKAAFRKLAMPARVLVRRPARSQRPARIVAVPGGSGTRRASLRWNEPAPAARAAVRSSKILARRVRVLGVLHASVRCRSIFRPVSRMAHA